METTSPPMDLLRSGVPLSLLFDLVYGPDHLDMLLEGFEEDSAA